MLIRLLRRSLCFAVPLCVASSLPLEAQQQNILPLPTVNYAITQVATASISATTTSANASLGAAAATVFVTNEGPSPVCVALGGSSVTATWSTCSGGNTIYPGQTYTYGEGANTYIAAVTGTGTATVAIQTGYLSIGSSGGGGGGGGVVTSSPNGGAAGVLAVGGNASSTPLPVITGQTTPAAPDISTVMTGGTAVNAFSATHCAKGCYVVNPTNATVNLCGNGVTTASGTTSNAATICAAPGQQLNFTPRTGAISVVSSDSSHPFGGEGYQ